MLGLCCHYLIDGRNILAEKGMQLSKYNSGGYSDEYILQTYVMNIENIHAGLKKYVLPNGITHFRVSSSILPLADQVTVDYKNHGPLIAALQNLGSFIFSSGIRFTTHPGQFCVLSSDNSRVVDNTVNELAVHAWIFDIMGLSHSPYWSINIHGGKSNRSEQLVDVINSLPKNIKNRLTLENDEFSYNVIDLIHVYLRTNVPICFDSHHHVFNDGSIPIDTAYAAACETWQDFKCNPLQHISNSKYSTGNVSQKRQHSDYITYIPDCQLSGILTNTIDLEIEAKMKNFAINDLRKNFLNDKLHVL